MRTGFDGLAVSPDGGWVAYGPLTTGAREYPVYFWRVARDDRPADVLRETAELLSGRRLDLAEGHRALSAEELVDRWEGGRRAPSDAQVTAPAVRAFRTAEIESALREGSYPAAMYHYWWLVGEEAEAAAKGQPAR